MPSSALSALPGGSVNVPALQQNNIAGIQDTATAASEQNYANSLATQATNLPQIGGIQTNTQNTIAANSANPYALPTQVQQAAVQGAGTQAAASGITGAGARGTTSQAIGLASLAVGNNNIAQQQADLAANPAPVIGASPATLTSAQEQNTLGANNYNLGVAGLQNSAQTSAESGLTGSAISGSELGLLASGAIA